MKSNNKVVQIGVYEILSSDLKHYTDEEGKLEIEKLNDPLDEPLIYIFVTRKMLENLRMVPESGDIVELPKNLDKKSDLGHIKVDELDEEFEEEEDDEILADEEELDEDDLIEEEEEEGEEDFEEDFEEDYE